MWSFGKMVKWKEFEAVFTIGNQVSQSYFMALKNDGEGQVYFDDIKMEKVTLPVTSVVTNGSATLYAKADPVGAVIPSPEDGVPFPAMAAVGLFLGGAAMIVGKKRRDEE